MKTKRHASLITSVLLCFTAAACTGSFLQNYGRINPDVEITLSFEDCRVNGEMNYYISGSDLYPNALMGLRRDYRLDPETLWKRIEMTPAIMKEIVWFMQAKASEYRLSQYGFEISDDKGRPIGVWYSILSARTFIRMQEDGTVRIDTPPLETYEKFEIELSDF